MFWTVLAWLAFIVAGIVDWKSNPGSPDRTTAVYLLAQSCFFMLCAIKERLTKRAA